MRWNRGRDFRNFTRRDFLDFVGKIAAICSMPRMGWSDKSNSSAQATIAQNREGDGLLTRDSEDPASPFESRYRKKWSWEKSVRGTHNLNCWYQQNCAFHIFTKEGKVIREEQVGEYPQTHAGVPDFNPRGCQKGCSYSELIYSPARLRKPLKRVGKRGEGKWQEISWDQALEEIASQVVKALGNEGCETVVADIGGNAISQIAQYSFVQFFDKIDAVLLDCNCELGDDQQGAAITYGDPTSDRSGDDYFYSDLILIWGGNPAYTQIPNFHFLTEARYNGAEIIAISPDLNASAIHADRWVSLRPGTDAALGLSIAHVLIEEKLYAEQLIREQTDLPMLVRTDNQRFLRESDRVKGGSEEILYRYDLATQKIVAMNLATLELGSLVPALEGEFEVETLTGKVRVEPVFAMLSRRLKEYSPEAAAKICDVPAKTIRELAHKLAKAKAATNTCTSGISKFYHGDLMMRAQILVFVLSGHLGRKGAGYVAASLLLPGGAEKNFLTTSLQAGFWKVFWRQGSELASNLWSGMSWRKALYKGLEGIFVESKALANSTLFWNLHGGLLEVSGRSDQWDSHLKRNYKEYLDYALKQNWQYAGTPVGKDPKILFVGMGNPIRRVRNGHRLIDTLLPKLDLFVVFDLRMSSSAQYADIVLPISSAYEKTTSMAMNTNPISPFLHTTQKAIENVGESKDEWEAVCLLAEKIEAKAKAQGLKTFKDRNGKKRDFDDIVSDLTKGGRYAKNASEMITADMIESSDNLESNSWKQLKKKGFVRFSKLGSSFANAGNATEIRQGETISPHTLHLEKKQPWSTLTGRVQFYVDHPWYLELDEALLRHKEPPLAGGDFPLTMTGGHARWSIHATWRTDPIMLRLQRGEPCLWISVADATQRKIRDGEKIRVFNDVGIFVTYAKISPAVRPGQVIMYHAWEEFQFADNQGYRNVQASPLNPLELVGDYPYFKPTFAVRQPGQNDRDTRVEVAKIS